MFIILYSLYVLWLMRLNEFIPICIFFTFSLCLQEAKMKKKLKMKLEMAKFLQQTLDSMAVEAKGRSSDSAKEFVSFFEKVSK